MSGRSLPLRDVLCTSCNSKCNLFKYYLTVTALFLLLNAILVLEKGKVR